MQDIKSICKSFLKTFSHPWMAAPSLLLLSSSLLHNHSSIKYQFLDIFNENFLPSSSSSFSSFFIAGWWVVWVVSLAPWWRWIDLEQLIIFKHFLLDFFFSSSLLLHLLFFSARRRLQLDEVLYLRVVKEKKNKFHHMEWMKEQNTNFLMPRRRRTIQNLGHPSAGICKRNNNNMLPKETLGVGRRIPRILGL